jgi:hypothetical protein
MKNIFLAFSSILTLLSFSMLQAQSNEVVISGTRVVDSSETFSLKPGQTLVFESGARLLVYGGLDISGKQGEPVKLISRNPESPGLGIVISDFKSKNQDIVICTALIPGKKAPRIVTDEMVKSMKSGSVICDLAVEQGGNSAFSEPGKIVVINGVKIIGHKNFPSRISESASILFAKNVLNFLEIIYDKVEKKLKIDENDEIIKAVYINKEIH